jgi:hypothetical protein
MLADLWPHNLSPNQHEHRVQRGGWETSVTLDVVPDIEDEVYPQEVHCLLAYSLSLELTFVLILRAGNRPLEYTRCGISNEANTVNLTEDCERSTWHRQSLKISEGEDLQGDVRRCNVIEAWFRNSEEQEMILL